MPGDYTNYLFRNLPGLYRAEGKNGYVYRFLSLFGDVFRGVENEIDQIPGCLNPDKTRADLLNWLASWVALELDEEWPEGKRRELIKNMVELYKWQGTVEGIQNFVEIYTGIKPEIIEFFSAGWRIGVVSTIGIDTRLYEAQEDPYCFSMIVHALYPLSARERAKIMGIVEMQKPAHTKAVSYTWVPVV